MENALRQAIEKAGSQSALAASIGVTQQSVSNWLRKGKSIPPRHAIAIERETGVSRRDLCPDIFFGMEPAA